MFKLLLPGSDFKSTPAWWQNFVIYCRNKRDRPVDIPSGKFVKTVLYNEHGAFVYVGTKETDYLEFPSEEDAAFFKLKWC